MSCDTRRGGRRSSARHPPHNRALRPGVVRDLARGRVHAMSRSETARQSLADPEVRARMSEAAKAHWRQSSYRLAQVTTRRGMAPPREQSLAGLAHAYTPEALEKKRKGLRRAQDAALVHQDRMVAEMASRANVEPSMRDVGLMREWLSCGLRQSTLARWLGVGARSVSHWVGDGVKPKVKKGA